MRSTSDAKLFMQRVNQVNRLCQHEGWAIFELGGDGDGFELQRDDAMSVFKSDASAMRYVRRRAAEGSEIHKLALHLVSR